jgi:hypothetical protein
MSPGEERTETPLTILAIGFEYGVRTAKKWRIQPGASEVEIARPDLFTPNNSFFPRIYLLQTDFLLIFSCLPATA